MVKTFTAGCLACLALVLVSAPQTVSANGLFEDRSWQFESTTERAQKAAVLDLILRQKAGGYVTNINSTYTTNYNISGDYVDCNLTSQSLGNQGSVTQDAPVASPTIGVSSSTSSSASGNTGTGSVLAGGNSSNTGLTSQTDQSGSVTNNSNAGGTNSVSNNQSNKGSVQTSSANGNSFSSTVNGVSGTGGGASVALNSSQSMANSSVTSTVKDSKACDFNTVSGSIGSPINAGNAGGWK